VFHNISQDILDRMRFLEQLDAEHREKGLPSFQRLRQIPTETGKFLALLEASAPDGTRIEIGTSGGYSTLWLVLACQQLGKKITTFELLEEKASIARETFRVAGVEDTVELIVGDARMYLQDYKDVSFCFLDAEKDVYQDCYDAVIPNMVSGGLLVSDNAISHREMLQPMLDRALDDQRVDAMIVPIGRGELLCRKK
jgi:predicted O-methyltransferase YrrM